MENASWTCPFCGHIQTITKQKFNQDFAVIGVNSQKYPSLALKTWAIGCSNQECDEVEVGAELCSARTGYTNPYQAHYSKFTETKWYANFPLRPMSSAKPQPDYIPEPIRQDYKEACKILNLSPKASATLSRRCLQGMIRDFGNIKENNLYQEIEQLGKLLEQDKLPRGVTPESVEAAHAIRKIGNIGAHMEKDINVIIDVEPDEAKILIDFIESLFEEWYVARENRKQRFAKLKAVGSKKEITKVASKQTADSKAENPD